jgi:hypothetical protein
LKTIFEPVVHLAQTMHPSCINISTVSKWTESSFYLSLVTKEYRAAKIISEPMVLLAQIIHLSYTDTNTVSKLTEMKFDMTHVTLVFY